MEKSRKNYEDIIHSSINLEMLGVGLLRGWNVEA